MPCLCPSSRKDAPSPLLMPPVFPDALFCWALQGEMKVLLVKGEVLAGQVASAMTEAKRRSQAWGLGKASPHQPHSSHTLPSCHHRGPAHPIGGSAECHTQSPPTAVDRGPFRSLTISSLLLALRTDQQAVARA